MENCTRQLLSIDNRTLAVAMFLVTAGIWMSLWKTLSKNDKKIKNYNYLIFFTIFRMTTINLLISDSKDANMVEFQPCAYPNKFKVSLFLYVLSLEWKPKVWK